MIRHYHPRDLSQVVELGKRVAKRITRDDTDSEPEVLGRNLEMYSEYEDGLVLVSEADGRINGILVAMINTPLWNSRRIARDLMLGAEGCGEELVASYKVWALARGAEQVCVHCNSGSKRAEQFYDDMGAKRIGSMWEI